MRAEAGDRVVEGQVLAILDSSVLQAQLAQAEAGLAQAQVDIQRQQAIVAQSQVLREAARLDATRYSSLYEAGAISQAQLGDRQVQALTANQQVNVTAATLHSAIASVKSKMAEVDRIKALLAQTTITAPATGTIAKRFTSTGDTANSAAPLYSLIENHQHVLSLQPTQQQLAQIDIGTAVNIRAIDIDRTGADGAIPIRGSVYAVDPTLNPQSRQATIKVAWPEEVSYLRAGMFLQASIITVRRRSVVVPAASIVTQSDGRSVVFILREQYSKRDKKETRVKAKAVSVSTESADIDFGDTQSQKIDTSSFVEILSGLQAGSRIVVEGASYLQDGDSVEVPL